MSKKPHCFRGHDKRKMLKGLELLLERIKKFNEISRSFRPEILEINFSHAGCNRQTVYEMQKALKMLGNRQGCTIEAGRCIQ
jgi:predicted nuclease of restriction endonuclease-like RecB superfamily